MDTLIKNSNTGLENNGKLYGTSWESGSNTFNVVAIHDINLKKKRKWDNMCD